MTHNPLIYLNRHFGDGTFKVNKTFQIHYNGAHYYLRSHLHSQLDYKRVCHYFMYVQDHKLFLFESTKTIEAENTLRGFITNTSEAVNTLRGFITNTSDSTGDGYTWRNPLSVFLLHDYY